MKSLKCLSVFVKHVAVRLATLTNNIFQNKSLDMTSANHFIDKPRLTENQKNVNMTYIITYRCWEVKLKFYTELKVYFIYFN